MRTLWSYEKDSKAIKDAEDRVVLFGDDINEEVLQKVTDMWNGKSTDNAIQGFLDRSYLCTSEEGDYIVEQIESYQKQVAGATEDVTAQYVGKEGENVFVKANVPVGTVMDSMTQQEVAETLIAIAGKQPVEKQKRQQRTTAAVKAPGKLSAEELAQLYTEKIAALTYIATVDVPELTSSGSKGVREILIQLQKSVEQAKETAVQNIQQL